MSRSAVARQPRQTRESKTTTKALQPPAHAPRFVASADATAGEFDDWEASAASVDLLIRCLTVYQRNEGAWHRGRVQRDLWRAVKTIEPYLYTSRQRHT